LLLLARVIEICIRYADLELLTLETTVSHFKIAATPKSRPILLSNRVIFIIDQGGKQARNKGPTSEGQKVRLSFGTTLEGL
jgi:hypothetical protein